MYNKNYIFDLLKKIKKYITQECNPINTPTE